MIKETDGDNFETTRSLEQTLTFTTLKQEFADAGMILGPDQMRTLGLVDDEGLYSNLALLLAEECPFTIKVGVFQGTDVMIFKHRQEFGGSLFKQLQAVYDCCDRYNQTRTEFGGLKRIDTRDYPEDAVREGLVNILVHRDYSVRDSALISIFDDHLEFKNFGSLVEGLTTEDIYAGVSKLRNRNLAGVFYRLKLIEAYGTGLPRIFKSYDGSGLRPDLQITPHVFSLKLPSLNYRKQVAFKVRETVEPFAAASSELKSAKQAELFFTVGENKVLELFVNHVLLRRPDLEQALKISQPMAIKLLRQLLDKKAIIKLGRGKSTCYKLAGDEA